MTEDNLLQKAFYLGVGIAGLAVEKANDTFQELKQEAEKLTVNGDFPQKIQQMADEMVNKGKMNTEEAKKFVEDMLKKNQPTPSNTASDKSASEPRIIDIEIIPDDDSEVN